MLYMVTFTINIPPTLAYIPYMDPMGIYITYIAKWGYQGDIQRTILYLGYLSLVGNTPFHPLIENLILSTATRPPNLGGPTHCVCTTPGRKKCCLRWKFSFSSPKPIPRRTTPTQERSPNRFLFISLSSLLDFWG